MRDKLEDAFLRLRAVEQDLNHLRRVMEGLVQRVDDIDEVLRAENARSRECSEARLAGLADRDRRLDQIAAAAALVQTTVQRYFDQHGPSCDEHADEPDHTCPTCCIDIDASDAISGLKFWSKP